MTDKPKLKKGDLVRHKYNHELYGFGIFIKQISLGGSIVYWQNLRDKRVHMFASLEMVGNIKNEIQER